MGQTSNYGFKQWEAWERPRRGEINGALAAVDGVIKAAVDSLAGQLADKSSLVTGSYTGDNADSRVIALGFTPAAVLLENNSGKCGGSIERGLALSGVPVQYNMSNALPAVEIVDGGFRVWNGGEDRYGNANSYLNCYRYLALVS